MPAKREILQETLEKAFPNSDIAIIALTGDDDHWEVRVKSPDFKGKNRVDQHRAVMAAVSHLNIHALAVKTLT